MTPPVRVARLNPGSRNLKRAGLALAAGALAGLWIDTMRRTARAEREHPPLGDFVDAGGTRMHVLERGRGHPVVFLHGSGTIMEDWVVSGFLDQTAQRWRAIAVDRPGSGYSERAWGTATPQAQARVLHDTLVAMNVRKPVLVGHSIAGPLALAYALEYPHEIGGVVFLSGYAYPTARADFVPFMTPAIPLVGQVLSRTVLQPIDRALMPALLQRIFQPNPVPDYYDQVPTDIMLRPTQLESVAADIAALIPAVAQLSQHYGEIDCPVAIVAGEDDRIVDPYDHARRLHDEIRGSTLHMLAGTGHMPHHVRPDAVFAAIERVVRAAGIEAAHAAAEGVRAE